VRAGLVEPSTVQRGAGDAPTEHAVAPASDQGADLLANAALSGATPATPGGPLPVLVVDDSPVNRLVTSRMVTRLGYPVESAASAAEALALLERQRFAVILTDCYMPEMDGFSLTRVIRRQDRDVPIIAMTADVLDETRERCAAIGMSDYLTKPLRLEHLESALARWHPSCPKRPLSGQPAA
jgi:CheY-like chemotaxis protein